MRNTADQNAYRCGAFPVQIVLGMIVLIAALVRLAVADGLRNPDAALYAEQAYQLSIGHIRVPDSAYSVRYGLIAPIALCFRLFGVNDTSLVLFPLLSSMVTILASYRLGVLVQGRLAGLMAAGLLAILPVDVMQSTDLHADVPMSMWLTLCLLCFISAARAPAHRKTRIFACAGVMFGLAYLTKITTLAFFPALLALAVHYRTDRRTWVAPVVFLLVLLTEASFYTAVTGQPGYRLSAEMGGGNHGAQIRRLYPSPTRNIWLAFIEIPDILMRPWPLSTSPNFGVHFLLVPFAVYWALRNHFPALRPLLIWGGALYLPLSFGIIDYKTFAPVQIRAARVLEPICVPCLVVLACWLASRRPKTCVILWIIVGTIASMSILIVSFESQQEFSPVKLVYRQCFSQNPDRDTIVYCDHWLIPYLKYLDRFKAPSRFYSYPSNRPEGYYVVNHPTLNGMLRWDDVRPPEWVQNNAERKQVAIAHRYEQIRGGYRKRAREGQSFMNILWAVQQSDVQDTIVFYLPSRD
jgi:4-amino-4-deoxy-L-arabinose transferase-like glycosyltransferase